MPVYAFHRGSIRELCLRLILEVAVHDECPGQRVRVALRKVTYAADGEMVHLEPSRLVGLPAVIADAACLDAYREVFPLVNLQHDAHGMHDGMCLVACLVPCEGAHLVGLEDLVVVALVGVILHVVVGKESAGAALAGLVEKPAPDLIDARLELVGGDGLIEAEVFGHRLCLEPADGASVAVVDGAVAVADAIGIA